MDGYIPLLGYGCPNLTYKTLLWVLLCGGERLAFWVCFARRVYFVVGHEWPTYAGYWFCIGCRMDAIAFSSLFRSFRRESSGIVGTHVGFWTSDNACVPAAHSLSRGCYADFLCSPIPHEPSGGVCAVLVVGGGASPTLHFPAVGSALRRRAVSFLALFREAGILLSAMNGRLRGLLVL